ncbi:MAG TPA: DUF2232 domain-containing protein [bacterium]|nr:DUF2232 domain-containing protein [bacterium]
MFIAFAVTTGLTLVLFLTGLFVVFTPLPVAMTILRKGMWPALVACAAALAGLVMLYQLPPEPLSFLPMMVFYPVIPLKGVVGLSVIYLFYYLWLGWVVALASRKTGRLSALEPSVALMTLSGLILPVFALIAFAFATKMDLGGDMRRGLEGLFQKMIELQQSAGVEEQNLDLLRSAAPLVVTKFLQILPSLWIDLTLVVLSLTVLFLRRWLPAVRPFPNWPEFGLWRLQEHWIWLPIAAGSLYFANAYLVKSPPVAVVVLNALIVLGAVYFFQGLSVASYFFKTRLSPMFRMAGYVLFFLFSHVGLVVVTAVGLLDFWFDFRKLKKIA